MFTLTKRPIQNRIFNSALTANISRSRSRFSFTFVIIIGRTLQLMSVVRGSILIIVVVVVILMLNSSHFYPTLIFVIFILLIPGFLVMTVTFTSGHLNKLAFLAINLLNC